MDTQSMPACPEEQLEHDQASTGKHNNPTADGLNFRPFDQCSLPRIPSSSVGILHVLGYTPPEGEEKVPITVNFNCTADLAAGSHIRLVVGRRAVGTKVRELEPPGYGHWQLEAAIPPFTRHSSAIPNLPLTVQALTDDGTLLDSVTFGEFTYWLPERESNPAPNMIQTHTCSFASNKSTHTVGVSRSDSSERLRKRSKPYSRPSTPESSSSSEPSQSRSQMISTRPQTQTQTQTQAQGLRRVRQSADASEDGSQTAVLEIMVVLDSFCYNWDDLELQAGRRLVRFSRLQDGNKLLISAERILPNEYDAKDIVVSCIYREETDSCCITSVDIIHLLQRLVGAEFVVEEKNRIRRNLEGLRPTTVSKSRPGFESFFQRIMNFPDPKPRKIEKDLKVFDWKLLPQALDKIVSKYSLSNLRSIPTKESSQPASGYQPTHPQLELSSFCDIVSDRSQAPHTESRFSHYSQPRSCQSPQPELGLESPLEDPVFYHMPDDHLHPVYAGPELVSRYYPHGPAYFVPSMSSYPQVADPLVTSPLEHSPTWDLQSQHHAAISDHHQDPAYEFISSQESLDMYSIPQYNMGMNTYDAFEFQTLREHNINAAMASQVA